MNDAETGNPKHIAIIMDGNGRWACARNLPRIEGHRQGVRNVELVVEMAAEIGLDFLTLYAFSSENWKRPEDEVNALMRMLKHFLSEKENMLHKHQIRLRSIGRIEQLPADVVTLLREVEARTCQYSRNLTLALNYGSRLEVVDAVKSCMATIGSDAQALQQLTWEQFSRHLYTGDMPDPDLIIRTSGETRLSNFLLLQAAYAEIHYSPVNWPDFGREAFEAALADYRARERRFGRTGEQLKTRTS